MKQETLNLDGRFGAEFAGKYFFKEPTWATRNRIIQKYTKYNNISGEVISSDFIAIQAETIMACLYKQPEGNPVTLVKLLSEDPEKGLPFGLGELLAKYANQVCALTQAETRFLSSASDDKSLTLPLPNSGFPKNSDGPQTKSLDNPPESSTNTS